jgi:hypothetical protein
MGDSFLVDESFFTILNTSVPYKKIKSKYGIEYPTNVELVCEQYVKDCLKGTVVFPTCNVLIGDKSIIIIDEESTQKNKAVIFICSLFGKDEDYNCSINVDYIIIYNNLNVMNEELKEISLSEGINNYLIKRKIDIKNNEEQNIIDSKNENIGKFFIAKEDKSKPSKPFMKNPFCRQNNNKNINKNDNQNNFNNNLNDNNNNINVNNNFYNNNFPVNNNIINNGN